MDGWITIGTKIDDDKFDKQLIELDKKIDMQEKKKELKYKAKIEAEQQLAKQNQELDKMKQRYDELAQKQQKFNDLQTMAVRGELTPKTTAELKSLGNEMAEMRQIGQEIDKAQMSQSNLQKKVEQTSLAYQNVVNSVDTYKRKVENVKYQKQQTQVKSIKKDLDKIGKSSGIAVKQLGRMALGLFSIAGAYNLVSRASSTLGQYDKEYSANLEYIQYLLAQALAPALKYLVNLAGTLLSYLNYIAQAWFNVTLFSKNSASNFAKAQGSTSKMKKDLQSTPFDEMNVLQDTSTSGAGAGIPDIDPTQIQGEPPQWLKWIVDNKDIILSTLAGILGFVTAIKLGLGLLTSLGIGVFITGITLALQAIIEYMKDPTWKNFGKVIQGIGIAVLGLALIFTNLPLAFIGAIALLWGTIVKYWEQIKGFLQKAVDWLEQKSDWVHQFFGDTIGDIYDMTVGNIKDILNWFDMMIQGTKKNFDEIIKFVKNVFTGNWKGAWENIGNIFSNVFHGAKKTLITVLSFIDNILLRIGKTAGTIIGNAFKSIINAVLRQIESVLNAPIRAINDLVSVINNVPGINIGYLNTIRLPRLKVGGIINLPGRGVPVGGGTAIGGEAGREGVIPLTDSQAMQELGEAIGRYITINANITNNMNGRMIARIIQQIQNEQDFAYNR